MKKVVIMLFASGLLSGCATMFGNSSDLVNIKSNDPNAAIVVNGNIIGKGTAQYSVPRGKSVIITAEKKGCSSRSVSTEKSLAGVTWLNLLNGAVGFIVDAATGAIQKTDPTNYTVTPDCGNS